MSRKHLLAAGLVATLAVPTIAVAAGEGDPLLGGVRNPSPSQSQELTRETEIIAETNTYGTRQSNKSNNGGGAIYGCRSGAGGSERGNEPCVRANNLSGGRAFEFESGGAVVGRIDGRGAGGDAVKPFTTNATGVADGLNADRVDGLDAAQIVGAARANLPATRWALVNEAGQIEQQTGGFTTVNCYQANANCYIDAGEDVRNNGIHAQIIVQNSPDIEGDNIFTGETGAAPCGAGFVTCAPPGTEDPEVLVVAPRRSDGTAAPATNRFRFYVFVTESQAG